MTQLYSWVGYVKWNTLYNKDDDVRYLEMDQISTHYFEGLPMSFPVLCYLNVADLRLSDPANDVMC